jgi:hypothetical protein
MFAAATACCQHATRESVRPRDRERVRAATWAAMRRVVGLGLLVAGIAGAIVLLRWRGAAPALAPDTPHPAVAAAVAPAVGGSDPAPAVTPVASAAEATAPAAARAPAPAATMAWTPAARAVLDKARWDSTLTLVTAEVTAVGTIARAPFVAAGPEYQSVRLFVLQPSADGSVPAYAMLDVPLCPTESERQFDCATPFHLLQPGEVRTFVLARGRPNLGGLGKLAGKHARWLVLAGPEVSRPADPVLARVPAALWSHLGRHGAAVFAARVHELHSGDASGGLRSAFPRLTVDVLDVARHDGPAPRGLVRFVQEPFVGGVLLDGLAVGRVYWFAADGAGPLLVLRAWAER